MDKENQIQETVTFTVGQRIKMTITDSATSTVLHAEGEVTRASEYGIRVSVKRDKDIVLVDISPLQ